MSNRSYENLIKEHYDRCFYESQTSTKAKKDIVGVNYEYIRRVWIKDNGLDVATKEEKEKFKKMFGGTYDADQYIVDPSSRTLLALEEDKGHYVDKCFFKRALINFVETIAYCLKNKIEVPYFILSCPTKYSGYGEQMQYLLDELQLFNDKVTNICKEKIKFFHQCVHGRVGRTKYLTRRETPFTIDEQLVKNEQDFFSMLRRAEK